MAPVKADSLRLCPCCKDSNETRTHMLQCKSNLNFESSVRTLRADICTSDAHPVHHLIYVGLYHSHMHQYISNALESQLRIGWQNVLKGYLSKSWWDLASMPIIQNGTRDEAKGTQRMQKIFNRIYSQCIRLWKGRNEALHSKNDADLSAIRSAETVEITQLYLQQDQMCYSDRYVCARPLEQLLSSTPATRRRWLRRVKASRDMHIRDGSRQVLITAFLYPQD